MNEYQIIFGILFIYGIYNIANLYKQNILTRINVTFYTLVIILAVYAIFFTQRKSNQNKNIQHKQNQKSQQQQKKQNNYENRVNIIKIDQEKHNKILQKLSYDPNLPQNKKYTLLNVFKVKNQIIQDTFYSHQKLKVEKAKLIGQCGPANTNYGFHGTKKTCSGYERVCQDRSDCSFCNILIHGFRNSFSGKGLSTDLRYGKGSYFSPEIQKALQYCQSDEKILLCCKIVMGRVFRPVDQENYYTYFQDNQFDCVYADPDFTIDVKAPEICMKNEKGCLPKYILIFKCKGISYI